MASKIEVNSMFNDYQDKYLNIGDLELHYLEWGLDTNPTVILLHGLRGHAHSWDEVSNALKDKFHVLALDQRGRGSSDWSPSQDYSIEAYSNDLLKFSDMLNLPNFILIGHSMGGRNSMYFASRHPGKLSKLGIIDIGPRIDSIGSQRIGDEMASGPTEFPSIQDVIEHLKKSSPFASEDTLARRAKYATKITDQHTFIWTYDPAIRDQRKTGSNIKPIDLSDSIRTITCPTMIFRGMQSDILSEAVAAEMVQTMPSSNTVAIDNATHTVFEDNPADFIKELLKFLG